jgi:Uncharacterized conserved protein (DUF2075)
MATWIYQRPLDCCDPTELIVAKRLARLRDEWLIRWGFYYDIDREGDFLILGPTRGVLVLEVKAGALRRLCTTGRWEGPARDHPVAQLLAEWHAVIDRLRQKADGGEIPFVSKALCLPDVDLDPTISSYKEIDRTLIIDRSDLAAFETTWARLFTKRHETSSTKERKIFLDSFATEISPKAIRQFISETDRIILRHTTAEYQVLDMLGDNRQLIVQGGPGSGKTWLALEQAFRFADEGLRVLLLCYNIALANQLSGLVRKRKMRKGEVIVRSWESLARDLLDASGVGWDDPVSPAERELYFGEVVPSLMHEIVHDQKFEPQFDALVVDEAQDHDTRWPGSDSDNTESGWWEIYWMLLREKTNARMGIFYDQAQRPLFRHSERFQVNRVSKHLSQPAHVNLLFTLRYSLPIFRFLKTLQSESTKRLIENLRYRAAPPEGPDVELHEVESEQTALKLAELVTRWIGDGFCQVEDILILSPHSTKFKTSLGNCSQIGEWRLVTIDERRPSSLALLSVNKAKGLDSLAVIMIDVERFDRLSTPQDQMNYFMGASRARQLLAILHKTA